MSADDARLGLVIIPIILLTPLVLKTVRLRVLHSWSCRTCDDLPLDSSLLKTLAARADDYAAVESPVKIADCIDRNARRPRQSAARLSHANPSSDSGHRCQHELQVHTLSRHGDKTRLVTYYQGNGQEFRKRRITQL